MKRLLIISAFCLGAVFTSKAQGVGFGIKGGVNLASLSGDGVTDASNRTGIHFGAYARVKLGGIGLQPEAYYSAQGAEVSFANVKQAVDANYLNIPILLRFNPVPILNFHIGPQFGILMSADQAGQDIKDSLKSSDLSAAVGAGLDLPFGLNFPLRYVRGLSSINGDGDESIKNNTFQVSVGYDFVKIGK